MYTAVRGHGYSVPDDYPMICPNLPQYQGHIADVDSQYLPDNWAIRATSRVV
jgi:hypothetical protein